MFTNAKLQDRLWSFNKGWGFVSSNKKDIDAKYPLEVTFTNGDVDLYTTEGFLYTTDINPTSCSGISLCMVLLLSHCLN